MKYISLLVFFVVSLSLSAQLKHQAFDALGKGDLNLLSSLFDSKVELCFDNKVQYLDKQATINAVQSFLSKNPPKSCTPLHQGAAKGNTSQYRIGNFQSTNGKNFRVFIYSADNGEKSLIQELKIDVQ
ncbi:MAG: DUF4783 domain-containing protein [Saprospiraceae bacterium]